MDRQDVQIKTQALGPRIPPTRGCRPKDDLGWFPRMPAISVSAAVQALSTEFFGGKAELLCGLSPQNRCGDGRHGGPGTRGQGEPEGDVWLCGWHGDGYGADGGSGPAVEGISSTHDEGRGEHELRLHHFRLATVRMAG